MIIIVACEFTVATCVLLCCFSSFVCCESVSNASGCKCTQKLSHTYMSNKRINMYVDGKIIQWYIYGSFYIFFFIHIFDKYTKVFASSGDAFACIKIVAAQWRRLTASMECSDVYIRLLVQCGLLMMQLQVIHFSNQLLR